MIYALLLTLLYFALRLWGLRERPINYIFDEGVHFGLMELLAQDKGTLYRDFLFVHPPGVLWVGAWLWRQGIRDIYVLRVLYIMFCSLSLPPIYAIARRLYGPKFALGTLLLVAATPGLATWLGRTVMLDTALQVPIFLALWIIVRLRRASPLALLGAGAILGTGTLIKAVALPAALAFCAALLWAGFFPPETEELDREKRKTARGWRLSAFWFGAGFFAVFGVMTWRLWQIPNYGYYAYGLNGSVPFSLDLRVRDLTSGFYMLPLQLTFGVLGAWRMARRGATRAERFLGAFALADTLLMLLLPRNFYWRYLLPALPIYSLGILLWIGDFRAAPHSPLVRRAALVSGTLLCLTHLVTLTLYYAVDSVNPPQYQTALRLLRESPGPVFTLDPLWLAAAGQSPPVWVFACDAEWKIPAVKAPDDFDRALLACPTALLDHKTLQMLPKETELKLRTNYVSIFRYETPDTRRYVEIFRRREAPFPIIKAANGEAEIPAKERRH